MSRSNISIILAAILVVNAITSVVVATPSRPRSESNGLTATEVSTLWSRDSDEYVSNEEYHTRFREDRSAVQQLANGTDITFKEPPKTAAVWSKNDFEDLEAGDTETSVYPESTSRKNNAYIKEAHMTIFGVHPSTRGHLEERNTPLYISPEGTIRGFTDYRIEVPKTRSWGDTIVYWTLLSHDIEHVELKLDNETIETVDGTHTPAIDYELEDGHHRSSTLTIEAEIRTRLRKTVVDTEGTLHEYEFSYHSETVHVSDSVDIEVYSLDPTVNYAEYPNGDSGAVVTQTQPWHGVHFSGTTDTVRGVWRYYTARDTDWDTLIRSTASQNEDVQSDARPVYVHAYPSAIGPRGEPVRDGPKIIDTWGIDRGSPENTLGENISIEHVDGTYTDSKSIATRTSHSDLEYIEVTGVVRGESTTVKKDDLEMERGLQRSNLSVTTLNQNATAATIQIELTEETSGSPIALKDESRFAAFRGTARNGYITIGERRVETDSSGTVVVTVEEPGIHTVRYHPGSWLTHDPAYVGETTTLRFHPLATVHGVVAFFIDVAWQLLPFVIMFYAGHRLLVQFGFRHK